MTLRVSEVGSSTKGWVKQRPGSSLHAELLPSRCVGVISANGGDCEY